MTEGITAPRYMSVPDWHVSAGDEVAELCALAEFPPDPEQKLVLDALFAMDAAGRTVAYETAAIACRQNLKTGLFKQAALGWLYVTQERLVVWSAHQFKTAREAFRDLEDMIGASRYLSREVKRAWHGSGDESIEMRNGSRIVFKARTAGGGRGLTGDKVVLDEAFALKAEHMGALLPTLSARPDPQVVYGSSAAWADSHVLHSIIGRGRAGGDPRLAFFEWCAPDPAEACELGDKCGHGIKTPGCGCDNPVYWKMANPLMGRVRPNKTGLRQESIAAERRALAATPGEFGRERMGWHDKPGEAVNPITAGDWKTCEDAGSRRSGQYAFALDVAFDRSWASIAVAGYREDGLRHAEIVRREPGTGWILDWLKERQGKPDLCCLVIDSMGPAGSMEAELLKIGFWPKTDRPAISGTDSWVPREGETRLEIITGRDYAKACGRIADDVQNHLLRHIGQPELTEATLGADTRPLGDAWAWSRGKSLIDISAIVAVTLALHGSLAHGQAAAGEPFFLT